MACRFTELVVDSRDPESLASFWAAVLDYRVLGREEDGAVEIGPGSGFGGPAPTLVFAPVPDPTPGKVRLHIDLNPTDRDQDAELQRLLDLGATPVDVGQTAEHHPGVVVEVDRRQWAGLQADPVQPCCGQPGEPQERGVLLVGRLVLRAGGEQQERAHRDQRGRISPMGPHPETSGAST